MTTLARRAGDVINDYLLVWVLASVALGVVVPQVAVLTPLSTPILAVMIGSISLTLSPAAFGQVRPRALGTILLVQTGMPLAAYGVARLLSLSPELTIGFVGLGTLVLVPGAVSVLAGPSVSFETVRIVEGLLLAVVGPMVVAVSLRARYPDRVGQYDQYYPSISALMVILVIGIVTAANATLVRTDGSLVAVVALGALVLNVAGYLAGWLSMVPFERGERIAGLFSVGMRDFAVAAGLIVSAGLPPAAALPAVVFGVVEMTTSAGLARAYRS